VTARIARIGAFELDIDAEELRRSGRLVALTGQPMRVLILLVERAGTMVTRDELRREIWGEDTHVDFDAGLSTCINQIRTALGDRAAAPRFVETRPRRGYRFVARVEWIAGPSVETAIEAPPLPAFPAESPRSMRMRVFAVASIAAISLWSAGAQPARSSVPIAVFAVDVDPSRRDLAPVSRSLTDALIGALATEAGDRVRVAGPALAETLGTQTLDATLDAGFDYVIYVTLRSLGGPVLVHVKLIDHAGWVRWTSDRAMTFEELERAPLLLADEFSKPLVRKIMAGRESH
jgi:DNA-binding winged helix-turn-helix (wHTH) protein